MHPHKTQCAECGGTLQKKTITHTQPWGDELYRFESVPALVCLQCGHVWLEAAVSRLIDEMIKKGKPTRKIATPVYDLG